MRWWECLGKKWISWLACLTLIAILAGLLLALGWRHHAFEKWLDEGRTTLAPYPTVLMSNQGVTTPRPDLDIPLVETTREGRWVVMLSRSDYRLSLLGKRAWVKVHLVTARDANGESTQEIQLLKTLTRGPNGWRVTGVDDLALP